jgi:hypothetical protein
MVDNDVASTNIAGKLASRPGINAHSRVDHPSIDFGIEL